MVAKHRRAGHTNLFGMIESKKEKLESYWLIVNKNTTYSGVYN